MPYGDGSEPGGRHTVTQRLGQQRHGRSAEPITARKTKADTVPATCKNGHDYTVKRDATV